MEKAEQLSGRLREVLSSGQAYILTRFGVDLGLDPDLYPTWIVLSATAVVLLLLFALSWAAVRGAPLLGKTPTTRADLRSCEPDKTGLAKPVRAEEPRKRNKKKPPEKVRRAFWGAMTSGWRNQNKRVCSLLLAGAVRGKSKRVVFKLSVRYC